MDNAEGEGGEEVEGEGNPKQAKEEQSSPKSHNEFKGPHSKDCCSENLPSLYYAKTEQAPDKASHSSSEGLEEGPGALPAKDKEIRSKKSRRPSSESIDRAEKDPSQNREGGEGLYTGKGLERNPSCYSYRGEQQQQLELPCQGIFQSLKGNLHSPENSCLFLLGVSLFENRHWSRVFLFFQFLFINSHIYTMKRNY